MTNIKLTTAQENAIKQICGWYRQRSRSPLFAVYGYAGVGKTTITRYAIEKLGLDLHRDVRFATLTGKAALVMRRNGLPATTIHKLAYIYRPPCTDAIGAQEQQVQHFRDMLEYVDPVARVVAKRQHTAAKSTLRAMKQPRFLLNTGSDLRDAKLLVLDECSMIDEKMANDLRSFDVPILLLGDSGQLPPIKNTAGFGITRPDVFLEEIHRQAFDSKIVELATKARKGEAISYGQYSDMVFKLRRKNWDITEFMQVDQIICGWNKTRIDINNAIRKAKRHTAPLPVGREEKIIITCNDHNRGLLNGQFVAMDDVCKKDNNSFFATVIADEALASDFPPSLTPCYAGHFLDHINYDKERAERDWRLRRELVEADYGYAITAHKAQGSEWTNLVVVDDHWNIGGQHRRWLYTAITRAAKALYILE